LEFPEVFAKGGFDCILGNPPFLGGMKLTTHYGVNFFNYVLATYNPAKGTTDLVAYFFRRIFNIIRSSGFLSLISTNTIAQGDTREGGLGVIYEQGGTINHAVRSMRWPGTAAVEVSLVTICKGTWEKALVLNREEVEQITTYLDDQEYLGEPYVLKANENKSFVGSYVLGKGFVLEPEEAQALIDKNPDNEDVLFPYLNGQDLNNNVDQSPSRWVINFFDWPERRYSADEWAELDNGERTKIRDRIANERMVPIAPPDYEGQVAMDYPDCYQILEERVKPERTRWETDKKGNEIVGTYALRKPLPTYWWVYGEKRPALYRTIAPLERVISVALTSKTVAFAFSSSNTVFSHATGVIAISNYSGLSLLQSSFHFHWAWRYASSMKNDLRYTPSDVFETFPFPSDEEVLHLTGEQYFFLRKQLMESIQLGLTKTYNQFHNPQLTAEVADLPRADFQKQYGKETWNLYNHLEKKQAGRVSYTEAVPMIEELRRLHQEMDEAVLAAYGWHEDSVRWGKAIALRHDFYEVDYLPENDNIRYTIHPDARKEVLKRLLLLNHERYAEEVQEGLHGEDAELPPGYEVEKVKGGRLKDKGSKDEGGKVEEPKRKYKRKGNPGQGELF
jgi:Holliday junction resolvase